MRYIVDLAGYGKEFMNQIRTLSLGYRSDDPAGQLEREKFLYNDSANQIFMIMDADMPTYMANLAQLPRMEYFNHIPDLSEPNRLRLFKEQLYIFAVGLTSQIASKIGLQFGMDYMLEAIALDYMIVTVLPKSNSVVHDIL